MLQMRFEAHFLAFSMTSVLRQRSTDFRWLVLRYQRSWHCRNHKSPKCQVTRISIKSLGPYLDRLVPSFTLQPSEIAPLLSKTTEHSPPSTQTSSQSPRSPPHTSAPRLQIPHPYPQRNLRSAAETAKRTSPKCPSDAVGTSDVPPSSSPPAVLSSRPSSSLDHHPHRSHGADLERSSKRSSSADAAHQPSSRRRVPSSIEPPPRNPLSYPTRTRSLSSRRHQ